MSPLLNRHALWILLMLSVLLGCSGGESGTGAQDEQTTVGEITGFGSIYVSGIYFNTDNVTVDADDNISNDDSGLAVGMVVKVVGTVNAEGTEGVASQIFMTTAVEGLVFSKDLANDTINVMGQTINITNDTHFKDALGVNAIDQLVDNDTVVEVHGFTDGSGVFYATMIQVVETGGVASEVKLLGRIQNYTGTATSGSFTIGAITVEYDNATSFEDGLLSTDLQDDLYVSVESSSYSGGNVLATEIEPADQSEDEGTGYELEGIVTDISNIGINEFSLNGQRIVFNVTTTFEGGSSTDIQLEAELEVEGVFQADGSILAHEISFHTESDMEVEGTIASISGNTVTISGTPDIDIVVNELTSYEDEVGGNHMFHFDDLTMGMYIKVKYYNDGMDNIATRVEQTTP